MIDSKLIIVDWDGTIQDSEPEYSHGNSIGEYGLFNPPLVEYLNKKIDNGYTVLIYTAGGQPTLTKKYLEKFYKENKFDKEKLTIELNKRYIIPVERRVLQSSTRPVLQRSTPIPIMSTFMKLPPDYNKETYVDDYANNAEAVYKLLNRTDISEHNKKDSHCAGDKYLTIEQSKVTHPNGQAENLTDFLQKHQNNSIYFGNDAHDQCGIKKLQDWANSALSGKLSFELVNAAIEIVTAEKEINSRANFLNTKIEGKYFSDSIGEAAPIPTKTLGDLRKEALRKNVAGRVVTRFIKKHQQDFVEYMYGNREIDIHDFLKGKPDSPALQKLIAKERAATKAQQLTV